MLPKHELPCTLPVCSAAVRFKALPLSASSLHALQRLGQAALAPHRRLPAIVWPLSMIRHMTTYDHFRGHFINHGDRLDLANTGQRREGRGW